MDPELLQILFGINPAQAAPGLAPPVPLVPGASPPLPIPNPAPIPGPMVSPEVTTPYMQPPVAPPMMAPMPPRPVEPYMTDPLAMGGVPPVPTPTTTPSLGASLEPGVPMPKPRPTEASVGATVSPMAGVNSGLVNALKGIVGPAAPTVQKVSTPHAAPMAKMAGGNVAELLASLGIGPQQAFPGLKLPSTLGQALGGR